MNFNFTLTPIICPMKQLLYFLILGVSILIQGCGNYEGYSVSTCSCPPAGWQGHEFINFNIDFREKNGFKGNFIGFYQNENDCCYAHGRHSLVGGSISLTTELLNSNYFVAVYSSRTYIAFDGVFLPNQWTLQLWLNLSASSGIIMEENIGDEKAVFLSLTDDENLLLNLPPSDSSASTSHLSIESSGTLRTDTWQHIAVTVSKNNVAFYINGVLDKQQNFDDTIYNRLASRSSFSSEAKRLCFGSCQLTTGDRSFQGKIDNIEFINRVLSVDEIRSNYQASKNEFPQ
jgi:hypothetical protein